MDTDSAWSRVLRDPSLRDLPYKIETNEYGQIVMSPPRPKHGLMQSRITVLLKDLAPHAGHSGVEYPIETTKGVKVPDVIWMSNETRERLPDEAEASPFAPEICVEVLSPSNSSAEMNEKVELYLEAGAVEVWLCDVEGRIRFFTTAGEQRRSDIVPLFPAEVDL